MDDILKSNEAKTDSENIKIELDPTRENNFKNTHQVLSKTYDRHPKDFQSLVMRTMNEEFGLEADRALKMEDLSSLRYVYVISLSASNLAGTEVSRPILIFDDEKQFKQFTIKTSKDDIGSSWGYYWQPSKDNKTPKSNIVGNAIRKSGVIVSKTDNPDILGHEVRHSIEPHDRNGFDNLLSETFACAHDFLEKPEILKKVLKNYYKSFSKIEKKIDRRKMISGQPSQPRFGSLEKDEEWFENIVEKTVDKLVARSAQIGRENAQVELANSQKLEDYLPPLKKWKKMFHE